MLQKNRADRVNNHVKLRPLVGELVYLSGFNELLF